MQRNVVESSVCDPLCGECLKSRPWKKVLRRAIVLRAVDTVVLIRTLYVLESLPLSLLSSFLYSSDEVKRDLKFPNEIRDTTRRRRSPEFYFASAPTFHAARRSKTKNPVRFSHGV